MNPEALLEARSVKKRVADQLACDFLMLPSSHFCFSNSYSCQLDFLQWGRSNLEDATEWPLDVLLYWGFESTVVWRVSLKKAAKYRVH